MAFPDLLNFPEQLSLYTPFLSGLGLDPSTYNVRYPNTSTPVVWKQDSFLFLALKDKPFFDAFNHPTTGWIRPLDFNSNVGFAKQTAKIDGLVNYLSGFSTGVIPATPIGFRQFRAVEKFFTVNATITSLSARTIKAGISVVSPVVSATRLTALSAFIGYLSTTYIEAVSAKFDHLTAFNLSGTNANFINLTGVHISAHDITTDFLTATNGQINTLSSTTITVDNEIVNFDITADTVHTRDLFISGTCHGCPTTGGGGSSNGVFDGLTAEYIEIINHHDDVPALRVTQFWDQPVAIFFDVTGRPDRNFRMIASGGVDIPGNPGEAFTIALDGNNHLIRMGSNTYGQLGVTTNPVLTPDITPLRFSQVATKGATVLGVSLDGSVYAWGYNLDGQVGSGTFTNTNIPTLILVNDPNIDDPVVSVSTGGNHSAAVCRDTGLMYTWGSNASGQLGENLSNIALPKRSSPSAITETGFSKVACGGQHTIAIKKDGSLWAWGNNSLGQLGDGTFVNRLAPVLIDNTRIYTFISCGINHNAAIDKDNNLFMWGANGYKQLGNNSTVDSNVPTLVGTYKQVSCGFFHTVAIRPDGTIQGWGRNHKNQLISGATTSIGLPQTLDSQLYSYCTAGKDCTFGVTINGSTIGWGNNENHQLGFATVVDVPTPTTVSVGQMTGINVAMIIDGSEEAPGFVGINTSTPNKHLTVRGDISSSDTIFGNISAPTALIDALTGNTAIFTKSNISALNVNTLSGTNITGINVRATDLSATKITALTGIFPFLSSTAALMTVANISTANINTLNAKTATFSSISTQSLTADIGRINTLTVMQDLTVNGNIFGHIIGDISTNTAVINDLTARHIYATETLGIGICAIDALTATNTQLFVSGNTVLTNNLSVLGDRVQIDARMIVNSATRISNPHTETALVVSQSGGLPVAEFYYTHAPWEIEQIALFIDGYAFPNDVPVSKYRGGFVGVRTKNPNEALTVRGNISASGNIYTDKGLIRANAISATSLSADDAFFTRATFPNLNITGNLKAGSLDVTTFGTFDTITARKVTITDSLSVANLIESKLFKGSVSATDITVTELSATNSKLVTLSSHYVLSDIADFSYLSAVKADIDNLNTTHLTSTNLHTNAFTVDDITVNNTLTAKHIKTDQLDTVILGVSADATIGQNLTVTNDISVSGNVWVTNDVHAHRFFGEMIGPTVSIGNSADLISLSAQRAHINDLLAEKISSTDLTALTAHIGFLEKLNTNTGFISSLTSHDITSDTISATDVIFKHVTADDFKSNSINALTITIENTAFNTNLIVKQHGQNNLAEFYYNDTCTVDSPLSTALVIKGVGCAAAGGSNYAGGFVGVRTNNPNEALTVHGNISADGGLFTVNSVGIGVSVPRSKLDVAGKIWGTSLEVTNEIKGDVVRTNSLFANDGTIDILQVTDLSAVTVNVTSDLHVGGFIFGRLRGQFNGTGVNIFDELSTSRISADFAQIGILSATNIVVPGGGSEKWNKAFSVPTTINMVFDGGGQSIEPGTKSFIEIPYDTQLNSWALYSNAPCTFSVAVEILSSDFSSYPTAIPIHPTAPTLSPMTLKDSSSNLTTWNNILPAGTMLVFSISTVALPGGPAVIDSTLMTLSLRGVRI